MAGWLEIASIWAENAGHVHYKSNRSSEVADSDCAGDNGFGGGNYLTCACAGAGPVTVFKCADKSNAPDHAPHRDADAANSDGAGRSGRTRTRRALRQGSKPDHRRPHMARLRREARAKRCISPSQGRKVAFANAGAAAGAVHRSCRLRLGQRGEAGDAARRNGTRNVRTAGRRVTAGGPRWRCTGSARANFVRRL